MTISNKTMLALAVLLPAAALAPSSYAKPGPAYDAAVHECSIRAGKFSNITEQTERTSVFRACLGDHGFER